MTRWQANTLLLAVALIWGSAFVVQNLAMAHMGPMGFTGVRFLVGALVVAPLAWREGKFLHGRGLHYAREDLAPEAGLGLLLCVGAGLQQVGIQRTTVTNAGFLTALYVPLVPLLAWWRSGQAPQLWMWPASAGCLVGTYLLSGAGSVVFNQGDLWVLASVLPWALHILFVGEVAKRMAAPFMVACGQFFVCAAAALGWAALAEPFDVSALAAAAPAIVFTGIVSVGIGFTGQVIAQSNTTPSDAAILLSTETLFAALFGYALMGDRLGATAWAGAALIFGGMLAVQLLALRQPAREADRRGKAQNE